MKKILVIGSINIDQVISVERLPKNGETIFGNSIKYNSGGKGANQSVAIAKMNCDVKLLAIRGNDKWGDFCISSCDKFGINTSRIINLNNKETGLASIYVQNDGLNSIVVLGGANEFLSKKIISKNIDLIEECDFLVCQLETNNDAIFYAMKLAKKYSKITILNPAPAKLMNKNEFKNCDYLIPNETELETISGVQINSENDLETAILKLDKIASHMHIIVTFGSKGVFYYNKTNKIIENFPAIKTNVVDTTAAGDSFIGGFVSKISKGKSIDESINFGLKVASITVSKKGSQNSIPYYKDVE